MTQSRQEELLRLSVALALPFVATGLQLVIWPWVTPFIWILFFAAVFLSSWLAGRKGGIPATFLSFALVWYFFMEPRFSFRVAHPSNLWSAGVFIVMGLLFSETHERLRQSASQTATALRESESKFKAIVEQQLSGIAIIQNGALRYASPRFAEMFGFSRAEDIVDRLDVAHLSAQPGRADFAAMIVDAQHDDNAVARQLFNALRRDGSSFKSEMYGRRFVYEGAPAVIGMFVDVTDVETQRELFREQAVLLERVSRLAHAGGWSIDADTEAGTWTREVASIYDLAPGAPVDAQHGIEYYAEWARPLITEAVRAAIEEAKSYDLELEIVSARGTHKWVRTIGIPVVEDGKTVRLEGMMQDITAAKTADAAVRASETRYRGLFEDALTGVAVCRMIFDDDGEPVDWEYLDVNPAFSRITGIEGITGRRVMEALPEIRESNPELFEIYGRVASTGVPVEFETYVPVLPKGQWLRISVSQSAPGGFVAVFEDVTDRKLAEAAVRDLNATLEQRVELRTAEVTAANKELESFAYAVSHDLRAPLRAMSGFASALEEDYSDRLDDTATQYLDRITAAAAKMSALIDGLLALSRATRGGLRVAKVDLSDIATLYSQECMGQGSRRIVTWDIEPGIVVAGDAVMLETALRNLLDNAWKYSSKNERAHIGMHSFDEDGSRWICVSDDGAGFDPAYAARLFQPFQRLHRQDEFVGIGIGLATVQRIVHRHGGELRAEGSPGSGASFCFTLPERPPNPAPDTKSTTSGDHA